ncbi:MAG: TonB-dependent receptor [Sinimarinibacterium flocculans]|uniref:TonB-dependent receptor n=1 Tax=Sinimarinibacterium flocculans TaxID=985250 RepID=UPI003C5E1E99
MLTAAGCWLLPLLRGWRADRALEWRLVGTLLAAAALLVWLQRFGADGLLRWSAHLAAIGLIDVGARAAAAPVWTRPRGWTVTSATVLAAGLLWHDAGAQPPMLDTIAVNAAVLPADEIDDTPDDGTDGGARTPPPTLETIVVTGEKLGRSLNETASSVGIVTREDLAASSDAAMKDVVTQFANVLSAAGDREIAIRGVPQGGIGGEGETISVYLDGVALPARAASFAGPVSAWDLEQVEVLRGSQSTNQGRSSLAGSVVLRSREPTPYWDARARAGIISRGGHDYAVAGGGPIGETLRFRVAAQDRFDPGDIRNLTRNEDDAGRERTRNARAKLAWTPALLPGYRAQYGYTEADNEFGDPLHDSSEGARTETANVRGNEDDQTRLHSLEQSVAFGDGWRVDAISGWADFANLYVIDYDRSASDGGYSDNTVDEQVFSQELRLHYAGARLNAVLGAYVADGDKATETVGHDVAAAGGLVLLNGYIRSDSTLRTQALFAEADWDFADAWRLTAGLRLNDECARRHDESDLSLTLTTAVPGLPLDLPLGVPLPDAAGDLLATLLPGVVPPDYEESGRTSHTDLLPKLGLTWFTDTGAALSLTYQEGYRSGGTSISFFGGAVSPFEPEYTRTIEFAARSRWLDERLTLNANLFYTDWRDQQVTIGETSGFETTTANAGRSHYYGLEAEALWRFDAPFEVFVSAGLLHSEFDEFVNDGEDYADNEFPYAPDYSAGLGLRLREWRRLSGQINVNHIAAFYSDPDNDPLSRADARTLVNAKLGYRLPAGFMLAVYGRNLTDDVNRQGALVSGSRIASRYGEARSFGATLEWTL